MIPGEMKIEAGEIELKAGRRAVTLKAASTDDRLLRVGSRCHFFEADTAPGVNRAASCGMRLNSATPMIKADTETCAIRVDGKLPVRKPAQLLPIAQRYFLF